MQERIFEIIIYCVSELKQKKDLNEQSFEVLLNKGYSEAEISTALSWIFDKADFMDKVYSANAQHKSFRILHDAERDLFTDEAYNDILQLNTLGLLTNDFIEALIDRAVFIGAKKIDKTQLHLFMTYALFENEPFSSNSSRYMLKATETIH